MNRIMIKRTLVLVLFCSLLFTSVVYAETSQEDIDQAQLEIDELEQQREEAEAEANELEEQKTGLEGEMSDLNRQLTQITSEMNALETQITTKENEIVAADEALTEAQKLAAEQYEAMKVRIQYMYENGSTTMLQMLLEAESVADFLNRSEYITQINEYDRNMLENYNQLQLDISIQKENLQTEKEELLALQTEIQGKKENLDKLVAATRSKITQTAEMIAERESDVSELDAKIAEMEAYEEQLELQKAQEDAARLEAIKAQEEEDTSNVEVNATDSDLYLLGAIIQCEAEGESYEGKLAVGSVVINRVKSSYFPNTISGVIYQSGQFSPVASGRLAVRLETGVNAECLQAAQEVLNGNITNSCLYFRRNNGVIAGMVIGNHVFY